MFDGRISKGNPGILASCGIADDNQQHFHGEAQAISSIRQVQCLQFGLFFRQRQ
jgi:hypothetical protein